VFRGWLDDLPCYRCLVGHDPEREEASCADQGVLGPMTGMVGSLAALEAIRAITPFGTDPAGRLMLIDALRAGDRSVGDLAESIGVTLPNAPGTIDCDYRGEVLVPLINLGREAFTVTHGMRVAQMVIAPVAQVRIDLVEELDATERGDGGFGSTGRH